MRTSAIISFLMTLTLSSADLGYRLVGDDLKCGYDGRMFASTDTTNVEECHQRCYNMESCNFFTFWESENMCIGCTLENDSYLEEDTGFEAYELTTIKTPEDFGYELWKAGKVDGINKKCPYGHEDRIIKHDKTTKEECYEFCKEDPVCEWFSWGEPEAVEKEQGNCMLCKEDDDLDDHENFIFWTVLRDLEPDDSSSPTPAPTPGPTTKPTSASSSGDPHFKTWTGDKYDYHGECDLVLVDHPTFSNGMGLKIHIRTTRVNYFSYISNIAVQIGDDVLEFDNDVENFLINGEKVAPQLKYVRTLLGGFHVRRDPKAISIRLDDHIKAKIDLVQRKNGWPAVVVDGEETEIFKGSLGLLGDWETGKRLARDGKTEMNDLDATNFALEWQVRDTEPMLFKEARFPQYPSTCTPPTKNLSKRLGVSNFEKEAQKACAHWKEDVEDCIFDVIATRDVKVAEEGHIGASVA